MFNLDFVQVPVSALMNIKDTSIKVYSIIYTGCILRNNKFYHSYSQFVTELGVNIPYVKRALKDLKEGGFIEIESGRGAKKPNTFHLTNRVKSEPIDNNSEVEFTDNRVKSEPINDINRVKYEPQKEYIKENSVNKVNNMDYNSSTSRDTTEQSNNNMNFNKNGMYMELNSHSAVQSKDWTKETKEEKTHSSSASTTKIVQFGDTRYAVKTANTDYSSILYSLPVGTASREKKRIQQVTTTEDRNDNTQSNASLHNENEDNPMDCGGMSIDELENMFNGVNKTQTQQIYKGCSKTTSKAKYNEWGGGHKFTPRKEWDIAMRVVLQHINNSSDIHNELTTDDVNILYEGASDKYRVIDTIKAIKLMLTYRMKFPTYNHLLNDAIDTLEANEEAYTPKQFDYACEIYDDCADLYEKIINNK